MKTLRVSYRFYELVILIVALGIRLPYLGSLPPGASSAFWLRLPTCIVSIFSILFFMELINKLSRNTMFALIGGLVFTFMPWHIEQSRVASEATSGLAVILAGGLTLSYITQKYLKYLVLILTVLLFYFVYPSFWVFAYPLKLPSPSFYLANLFKLVSFDFLFFRNDAFWLGGLQSYGVFLPTTVWLFLVGLLTLAKQIKIMHIKYLLGFVFIWLIASANPLFPEQREYFLSVPYLAIVMSLGILTFFRWMGKTRKILKIFAIFYILLVLYDYALFTHFYITHYNLRIKQEVLYEKRDF